MNEQGHWKPAPACIPSQKNSINNPHKKRRRTPMPKRGTEETQQTNYKHKVELNRNTLKRDHQASTCKQTTKKLKKIKKQQRKKTANKPDKRTNKNE